MQLLKKGKVQGYQASFPLMEIVQGPIEMLLPKESYRFALTPAGHPTKLRALADATEAIYLERAAEAKEIGREDSGEGVTVFAIGVSSGDAVIEMDFGGNYCDTAVSICPWGLRSQVVCQMVCHEYENVWELYSPTQGEDSTSALMDAVQNGVDRRLGVIQIEDTTYEGGEPAYEPGGTGGV